MKISDFDYNLPKELIAIKPTNPRDSSRLFVVHKNSDAFEHRSFSDIVDYLHAGDVLVLNNTKVFPARLIGAKAESGGRMEVFLLKSLVHDGAEIWECLIGGRGARPGLKIKFDGILMGEVLKDGNDGTWQVRFNLVGADFIKAVDEVGQLPLPPYIEKEREVRLAPGKQPHPSPPLARRGDNSDRESYQTVYAADEKRGSVAAPTAGLHFTPELMEKLKNKGVQIEYVTLHVGMGTFAPVKVDNILEHKMHAEYVEIEKGVAENIIKAKKENRRIIAVGTTSARTLEAMFVRSAERADPLTPPELSWKNLNGWVDIFIYPGYEFKVIDGMITNFHLPKSTLLILISALVGTEKVQRAYAEAIERKYRFYSYGDAMLIV